MEFVDSPDRNRSSKRSETLITLVDESTSMKDRDWNPSRLAGAIEANSELIKEKASRHPRDRMGIIGFSGDARVIHVEAGVGEHTLPLTQSLNSLRAKGSTNFKAALKLADVLLFGDSVDQKQKPFRNLFSRLFLEFEVEALPKPRSQSLKRILMLTDGGHNGGGSPMKTTSHLKEAGVVIDCIGIGGSPKAVNETLLKKIASVDANGRIRYRFIGNQRQLVAEYQSLARHIRTV